MHIPQSLLEHAIQLNIQHALQEDIGEGDITALLTPETEQATATIISRENMILAGRPWVDALIQAYDSRNTPNRRRDVRQKKKERER